jgi:hypothetical protein
MSHFDVGLPTHRWEHDRDWEWDRWRHCRDREFDFERHRHGEIRIRWGDERWWEE